MGVFEIILIVLVSLLVVGVIVKSVIDKRKGKCSCDCCEGDCPNCHAKKK